MATELRYIENEGALFRGPSRAWPKEVYSFGKKKWLAYHGAVPKPLTWGTIITAEEAQAMIDSDRQDAAA